MLKCNFNDCDCDHSGTSPERDNKIIKCPDCEIVEYCSEKCFRLDRFYIFKKETKKINCF